MNMIIGLYLDLCTANWVSVFLYSRYMLREIVHHVCVFVISLSDGKISQRHAVFPSAKRPLLRVCLLTARVTARLYVCSVLVLLLVLQGMIFIAFRYVHDRLCGMLELSG